MRIDILSGHTSVIPEHKNVIPEHKNVIPEHKNVIPEIFYRGSKCKMDSRFRGNDKL